MNIFGSHSFFFRSRNSFLFQTFITFIYYGCGCVCRSEDNLLELDPSAIWP